MNKIVRIIYFFLTTFNRRDYERFGVEVFLENGYRVEIWDFTPFLNSNYFNNVDVDEATGVADIKRFASKQEAMKAIANLSNDCFIINHLNLGWKTYGLFQAISRRNIPYGILEINKLPPRNNHKRKRTLRGMFRNGDTNTLDLIKKTVLEKIEKYLFKQHYMIRPGFKSAKLLITAGKKTPLTRDARVGKETKTVKTHALDYDTYLHLREKGNGHDSNIAVFLDEYFPFHPDHVLENIKQITSPDTYYPLLCKFFDYIEDKLDLRIVVAAHPRSHYEKHPDFFQNREIVYGKTAQLIKDCRLVLLHCSTAINFAVLFNKPLLFIIIDEIKKEYESLMQSMRTYLGAQLVDLDASFEFDMKTVFSIDKAAYRRYKADFIKEPSTPEKRFWDIVSDRIKELH